MRRARSILAALATAVLVVGLSGCGIAIPADPEGTLDRVSDGDLRVGWSPDPGLLTAVDGDPAGSLPDLIEGFADTVDADVEWTEGSEETLVGMLERGELDVVAGGITDETLWVEKAGVTRGYPAIDGADGRSIVLLVPLGENAFLSELERYLDDEVGS